MCVCVCVCVCVSGLVFVLHPYTNFILHSKSTSTWYHYDRITRSLFFIPFGQLLASEIMVYIQIDMQDC